MTTRSVRWFLLSVIYIPSVPIHKLFFFTLAKIIFYIEKNLFLRKYLSKIKSYRIFYFIHDILKLTIFSKTSKIFLYRMFLHNREKSKPTKIN